MTQNTKTPVIVFDFGGVLIDWNPYYLYRTILGEDRHLTEQFLQEVDFYNWNLENDRGRSFEENAAELIARFPQHRDLIWAYHHRFLETVGGLIQPTVAILHHLKKAGYPVWGLSNWPADKFAQVRPLYDFFNHLDGMVVSGEVGLVKPERHIFDYLVQQVGRPAGECLFIDDSLRNITAARELGFQAILFQSAGQLAEELKERGILNGDL